MPSGWRALRIGVVKLLPYGALLHPPLAGKNSSLYNEADERQKGGERPGYGCENDPHHAVAFALAVGQGIGRSRRA